LYIHLRRIRKIRILNISLDVGTPFSYLLIRDPVLGDAGKPDPLTFRCRGVFSLAVEMYIRSSSIDAAKKGW